MISEWRPVRASLTPFGRSLIYLGEHATNVDAETLKPGAPRMPPPRTRRLFVPLDLPHFTLNSWSVAAFNEIY